MRDFSFLESRGAPWDTRCGRLGVKSNNNGSAVQCWLYLSSAPRLTSQKHHQHNHNKKEKSYEKSGEITDATIPLLTFNICKIMIHLQKLNSMRGPVSTVLEIKV